MRSALNVPELRSGNFDVGRTILQAEAIKASRTRNALEEENLKDLPAQRAFREEQRENTRKGWGREETEYQQKQEDRPMDLQSKKLALENIVLENFKNGLANINLSGWAQFRADMIAKKMGANYMPESFNNEKEFEDYKAKAIEKAEDRRARLQQKFQEEQQQRGFTHTETLQKQTQEAAETRQSKSEASAERRHEETLKAQKEGRTPIETEEKGFVTPDNAIGLTSPRWKTDKKLTPEAEVKKDRLMKEFEVNLKSISDVVTRPADKEAAKKRNKEIEAELDSLTGAKAKAATGKPTAAKATPQEAAQRLGVAVGQIYAQGGTPDQKMEAQIHAFLTQNPDQAATYWQNAEKSSNGKLKANGSLKGSPSAPAMPTQPAPSQAQPPNALGGEVSVNPYIQTVPQGLPSTLPNQNALVQPSTTRTGPNYKVW